MTKEQILQNCTVNGNVVCLPPGQLDRKLYVEVAKALEHIGGKWKGGKVLGFVFPHDPTDLLAEIANGTKRNLKKETQFFATPAEIAAEMVNEALLEPGMNILEPSAGQGAIIDTILKVSFANTLNVFYVEKDPTNQMILAKKGYDTQVVFDMHPLNDDFLNCTEKDQCFDRIIANPPFNKNQDIDHIRKMYEVLKTGGRIVTMASKHWIYSSNRKEKEFKDWLYNTVDATVNGISAGAFSESGTQIETVMIIIDKP